MIFPFVIDSRRAFSLRMLDDWIDAYKPPSIELTDNQYMDLAELMSFNVREYRGIPIVFVDTLTA